MRKIAFFLSIAVVVAINAGACLGAEVRMQTGFNFDWWEDDKDSQARQFQVPLSIDARAGDFSARVLTAYADTHLDLPGQGGVSLGNILDTKLVTSYQIVGKLPLDVILGLDLNLPTGKTNLKQSELALIMDPDLIPINDFGEGFNMNPTVTLAKEWEDLVAGVGMGYIWRGEYDFSSEMNLSEYQPGDIFNVNAEIRYYFSSRLYSRLFGSHCWYGKDTVRGADYYQEGDYSLAGLGLHYSPSKWDVELTMRGIFRDRSKFQATAGNLSTEPVNSHGDEWIGDMVVRYLPDNRTAFSTYFQSRYYTRNEYPSLSSRFVGRREKFTLGAGASRALAQYVEIGVDVKGFIKDDAETHFPVFHAARDFGGFSIALILAGSF